MNILVVGLGSMGKRRIRLLKRIEEIDRIIGVEKNEKRSLDVKKEFGIETFDSIEKACNSSRFDACFVCTSPIYHNSIINTCLKYNMHVFSEINLVEDGYEENIKLADKNKKILFLSSTPIYRKEISYITEKVRDFEKRLTYNYHIGQYLPDWHPWECYQDYFVANKRTNGCREIFAIELPWMIRCFGRIKNISSLHDKITDLVIDYDDSFLVTIYHESGHKGVLQVDVASPYPGRSLNIVGENFYLEWKGTPDSLREMNFGDLLDVELYNGQTEHLDGYQASIIEDAYFEEIKSFFSAIKSEKNDFYGFLDDLETLKVIDIIEA